MKKSVVLFAALSAALLSACAGEQPKKVSYNECHFGNSTEPAPDWVCDTTVEGVSVSAVGIAQKSAAGLGVMKQMAAANARVQLAQAMRSHVQNMVKQYVETTGAADRESVDKVDTSVSKLITDETLVGSRIYKSVQGPDGTLYVLVGIDPEQTKEAARQVLRTSMSNDAAAWQKFQAKKGFDELAAEIAAARSQEQQ